MGRTRFALAAVAAAVAGLSAGAGSLVMVAAPAGAAPPPPPQPPFASITDPSPSSSSPTVEPTATPTIRGNVSPPQDPRGDISSVLITITSKDHPGASFPATVSRPASGQSNWTFSGSVPTSQALAWNGPYQASATATEDDSGQSHQGSPSSPVNFAEGVAPQAPSGVAAAKDADGRAVTVSWQANPEPDILGYEVQRTSVNGSDWSTVSPSPRITDTNFRDSSVQSGTDYQYDVIAVRSGAQQGQTIQSSPSAPASTVAPPAGALIGPGAFLGQLPAAVQAITDPVAGLVHPAQGPGGPVTGSPTAGGYGNLPYGGQAALSEPGTPGAQDPKGGSSSANLIRTALFVAAALILLAIAAHLIRMRRALDDNLETVGVESWDRHAAGLGETAEVTTVGTDRRGSDVTRAMAAQRGGGRPLGRHPGHGGHPTAPLNLPRVMGRRAYAVAW